MTIYWAQPARLSGTTVSCGRASPETITFIAEGAVSHPIAPFNFAEQHNPLLVSKRERPGAKAPGLFGSYAMQAVIGGHNFGVRAAIVMLFTTPIAEPGRQTAGNPPSNPPVATVSNVGDSLKYLFSSPNGAFTRNIYVDPSGEIVDEVVDNTDFSSKIILDDLRLFFVSPNGLYLRVLGVADDGTPTDCVIDAPVLHATTDALKIQNLIRQCFAVPGESNYLHIGVDDLGDPFNTIEPFRVAQQPVSS